MGLDKSNPAWRVAFWLIPLSLAIIAAVIAVGGDAARMALRFDRIWILEGETWRLVSGHVTHLGWSHLALNGAGMTLVWFLVGERFDSLGWWIIICTSVLAINVGLWLLTPHLIWYVGLSGLLHGLLAAGIVARLRPPDGETLVLAILLLAKLGWEQFGGSMPGSELASGGPVVVDAHLYGAAGGVLGALLLRIRVGRQAAI